MSRLQLLTCLFALTALALFSAGCETDGTTEDGDTTAADTGTTGDDTSVETDTTPGVDTSVEDDTTVEGDTSSEDVADTTVEDIADTAVDTVEDTTVEDTTPDTVMYPESPTYHEDIAPVIAENCLSCHVPGSIAPFALEDYDSVKTLGAAVVDATGARRMPPWGADNSGDCQTFEGARWLDQGEIDMIKRWADNDYPEGDPANNTAEPAPLDMLADSNVHLDPGVAYTPDDSSSDDYRCFIVDPGNTSDKFLTAFQVNPGEPSIVHHMILYTTEDQEAVDQAHAKDAAEEGPGYTCFGSAGVGNSMFLAAWAPGVRTIRYPETTGVRVKGNKPLIMQVHYNVGNGALPDRTTVDLKLEDSVANEAYLIPIPHNDIYLEPGNESEIEVLEQPLDVLPFDIKLRGVLPHMHTLGKKLKLEFQRQGTNTCAVDVADWDFNWQQSYFYEEPLTIRQGSSLTLTCEYDTRSISKPVTWGDGTGDEMCLAIAYATIF